MAATSWDPKQPQIIAGPRRIAYKSLEANSQSFKAGAPVYSNAGAITIAAVGDVPFLGFAMLDGTNVTSGNIEIPVMLVTGENFIKARVTTSASVEEAANTTCKIGTAYDWNVDSGLFSIDSSDTTNPKLIFVQAIYDVNGDATIWGVFKPLATETQIELQ